MNFSHLVANPRLKLLVPLLAASMLFAALATTSAVGSGGISAGGGEEEAQASHQKKRYKRLYRKAPRKQKRWAGRTARCESGKDPKAIGGGGRYRGAFQFRKSTWRAAPKSPGGDPIAYNYKTQAVVAIALKRREGAHHWPSCG